MLLTTGASREQTRVLSDNATYMYGILYRRAPESNTLYRSNRLLSLLLVSIRLELLLA
jgi:hypothetical protein